jgi:hypothetical protein
MRRATARKEYEMDKKLARLLRSPILLITAVAVLLTMVSGLSHSRAGSQQSGTSPVPQPGYIHAVLTATSWRPLKLPYYTNRCLDAEDDSSHNPNQDGDKVQIWACNGHTNQNWKLVSVGGGYSYIENEYGNNLVIDATYDNVFNPYTNGDPIQLWTSNAGCQQKYKMSPYDIGFALTNACAGKVIDASTSQPGGPMTDGDYVQLWTWLYRTNQIWAWG